MVLGTTLGLGELKLSVLRVSWMHASMVARADRSERRSGRVSSLAIPYIRAFPSVLLSDLLGGQWRIEGGRGDDTNLRFALHSSNIRVRKETRIPVGDPVRIG